jgi:hypothetical protein
MTAGEGGMVITDQAARGDRRGPSAAAATRHHTGDPLQLRFPVQAVANSGSTPGPLCGSLRKGGDSLR